MPLLGFALALAGFLGLALAMDRHRHQLHHTLCLRPATRRARRLGRGLGALGLAASFGVCVHHAGWGLGPVLWAGLLSAAAGAVALGLSAASQRAARRFKAPADGP